MEENNIENANPKDNDKLGNAKLIAGAIVLAGVLIAGAILLKGSGNTVVNGTNNGLGNIEVRPVSSSDHILGNPKAKVVIVEYSDLECPFCKVFHSTMHQIVNDSKGEVAWVYRHYPISQLHPKAFREAEATECAWDQGGNDAFWKYTDRLFEVTASNNKLDEAELPKIAEYVGLDVLSFNACLDSGKFADKIRADMEDGNRAGVTGTPSSLIMVKGKVVDLIPGALPYESVMEKINAVR
ncbi:MAG TPA: thioredoxin domain-containing protein [Flavobacterium sp.]|nr:thioredoxin domain-containing protein [Flavobacterium sp.]